MSLGPTGDTECVFCGIVAGNVEARWEVRPTGVVPGDDALHNGVPHGAERGVSTRAAKVACFHNRLKWARVMLLVVPVIHMSQKELWSSSVMADAAALAVEMGDKHCGTDGYRVISNFGSVAHQSQVHAHLHVVSGVSVQIDQARKKPAAGADSGTFSSDGESGGHTGESYTGSDTGGGLAVDEYVVEDVPFAVRISPPGPSSTTSAYPMTQREFWLSDQILHASGLALNISGQRSPAGFRLMSSFGPVRTSHGVESGNANRGAAGADSAGPDPAGLFLLGGGQLGLYV